METAKICLALLFIFVILPKPGLGANPVPSPMDSLFGKNLYKAIIHVNAADKGEISAYYHKNFAGYGDNGFDAVFFTLDDNLMNITSEEPYNGGFESFTSWSSKESTVPGEYVGEKSSAKYLRGGNSLHASAKVSGENFGYAGAYQDMLWQVSAVAADLNFNFSIYPVAMDNKTEFPDSLFAVEFGFNYYNSRNYTPKMVLLFQENSSETFSDGSPFSNDFDTVYHVMNPQDQLKFNLWNTFSLNLTDLIVNYYGSEKALNLKINNIGIYAYSRNGADSEFYADVVKLSGNNAVQETFSTLTGSIKNYDSQELRMVPGERLEMQNVMLYLNKQDYFQKAGYGVDNTRKTIKMAHDDGGYLFVSKPDSSAEYRTNMFENLWPVDGMAVYFSRNMGREGFATDIWDYYLTNGIFAQGIAEAHPMYVSDAESYAKWLPAQYVYADDNSPESIVEALAQGRSFVERNRAKVPMMIFFSAENSQVPAGKFPVYVDSSRDEAVLDIELTNIPPEAKILRLIRNGTFLSDEPISGTSFSKTYTPSLPDKSNYFRIEILNSSSVMAFSNPIVYIKKNIDPDIWMALAPSLQQGSASSSIESISYSGKNLSFVVKSKRDVSVTTKIFSEKPPSEVMNAESWDYDPAAKIVRVETAGKNSDKTIVSFDSKHNRAPTWKDNSTSPLNPTFYFANAEYNFRISWEDDDGIGEVVFELNGANFTVEGNGDYSFAAKDLAAGNYEYRWYARDAMGMWNYTPIQNYEIKKSPINLVTLFLNGLANSDATTYESEINATAISQSGKPFLWRDGKNVGNPEIENLPAGKYLYKANASGNENYSSNHDGVSFYFTIDKDFTDTDPPKLNSHSIEAFMEGGKVFVNVTAFWSDNLEISENLIEENFTGIVRNTTMENQFVQPVDQGEFLFRLLANDTSNNFNATDFTAAVVDIQAGKVFVNFSGFGGDITYEFVTKNQTEPENKNTTSYFQILSDGKILNATVIIESYSQEDIPQNSETLRLNKFIGVLILNEVSDGWSIVKIYYDDSEVSLSGIDERSLRIWELYPEKKSWYKFDSPDGNVDTNNNIVWANVSNSGIYGVFGSVHQEEPVQGSQPSSSGGSGGGVGGGGSGGNVAGKIEKESPPDEETTDENIKNDKKDENENIRESKSEEATDHDNKPSEKSEKNVQSIAPTGFFFFVQPNLGIIFSGAALATAAFIVYGKNFLPKSNGEILDLAKERWRKICKKLKSFVSKGRAQKTIDLYITKE